MSQFYFIKAQILMQFILIFYQGILFLSRTGIGSIFVRGELQKFEQRTEVLIITLMPKKFAKKDTFGKLPEERPYQNNQLFKFGRVCFNENSVMKFILKFLLTLPYQVSCTSLHLLIFFLGVLPRNGGQVRKKLLLIQFSIIDAIQEMTIRQTYQNQKNEKKVFYQ